MQNYFWSYKCSYTDKTLLSTATACSITNVYPIKALKDRNTTEQYGKTRY